MKSKTTTYTLRDRWTFEREPNSTVYLKKIFLRLIGKRFCSVFQSDLSEKNHKLYWEFQYWANNLISGVINNSIRGSDGGVDGTFWVVADKKRNQFIFDKGIVSIKSGANISVAMVDSLFGAMKKNQEFIGIIKKLTLFLLKSLSISKLTEKLPVRLIF